MVNQQPEALRLADELEKLTSFSLRRDLEPTLQAAAELRRLHEENERMRTALEQHQVDHQCKSNADNDLACTTGVLITDSSTAPAGWKLVPVEPTEEMVDMGRSRSSFPSGVYRAMLSAAPQPQVEQEPVAWTKPNWQSDPWATAVMDEQKKRDVARNDGTPISKFSAAHTIPLYTHPQPPRQPLTDDEINTIWRNSTHMTIVEVVRAIEAAHGIGGES